MILWLTPYPGSRPTREFSIRTILAKHGIRSMDIAFKHLPSSIRPGNTIEGTIRRLMKETRSVLIVCECVETLGNLGIRHAPSKCRGSVYPIFNFPMLVVEDYTLFHKVAPHRQWIFLQDYAKIARWVFGRQRKQAPFSFFVVRNLATLVECKEFLQDCVLIGVDIETQAPRLINTVGFAGLTKQMEIVSWVIPLTNPFGPCAPWHWDVDEEHLIWKAIRDICALPIPKTAQLGIYDASYLMAHGAPLSHYIFDVGYLWHSIFAEARKGLDLIASVLLDYVQYWKDDAKEDMKSAKKTRFKSPADLEEFWKYNALDTYYTVSCMIPLLGYLERHPWAFRNNYTWDFLNQIGPALFGGMQGLPVHGKRHALILDNLEKESWYYLERVRTIADDPEFNPNSSQQYGFFLYDTLGATRPNLKGALAKMGEKSVDDRLLSMIADQHPIFRRVIDEVKHYKQPRNNVSKYGVDKLLGGRFHYTLDMAGTETGRAASKEHPFRIGTNAQNIPEEMRDIFTPDPGMVFLVLDYSQSDAYFMAFGFDDPAFIKTMTSGQDTHAIHCAFFFGKYSYEEILEGVAKGDPFFADKVIGIRSITKKIVHGKNYEMAGWTLLALMKRKAVIAAAEAMGFKEAARWDDRTLAKFCSHMLMLFDRLYPTLAKNKKEFPRLVNSQDMLAQCAFGRTRMFLGEFTDNATQREMFSFIGQGGTAMNIQRTMKAAFFQEDFLRAHYRFCLQVHDSFVGMTSWEKVRPVATRLREIMETPFQYNGYNFYVPTEAEVGLSLGKGLLKLKEDTTYLDLERQMREVDEKLLRKNKELTQQLTKQRSILHGTTS